MRAGTLARGHVAGGAEPFADLAVIVEQRHGPGQRPAQAPVRLPDGVLQLEHRLGSDRPLDGLAQARLVGRIDVGAQPVVVRGDGVGQEAAALQDPQLAPVRAHAVDDVRAGRDEGAEPLLARAQPILGALALEDVLEQDRHLPPFRRPDREGVDLVPAPERVGAVLEAFRLAGSDDPAVGLQPVRLEVGRQRPDRPADRVAEPGLLLEGRVHGQEAVVDRPPGRVEQDLDGAEALVDGVEEVAVPGLARAQLGLGAQALTDLEAGHVDGHDLPVGVAHGHEERVEDVLRGALAAGVQRLPGHLHGLAREGARVEVRDRRPPLRERARERPAETLGVPGAVEPGGGVVVDQEALGPADEGRDQRAGEHLLDHHLEALRPAGGRPQRRPLPGEVADARGHLAVALWPCRH